MDNNILHRSISDHFNAYGLYETLQFIMGSKEDYLFPRTNLDKELAKAKDYALLPKGEKTLVWFINHFDADKNRSIVNAINNTYNYTIEQKMSNSLIKEYRPKVKKLSEEQLSQYKTYKGVMELDADGLQKKSLIKKVSNIYALYTANIPNNLDYDAIVNELTTYNLQTTKQDLIAFLSIALERSYDNYLSISSSVWESFFGRRNIIKAKLAFEKLGLFTLHKKGLPGFRATRFKLRSDVDLYNEFTDVKITSIRTLEKISRVKHHKSIFYLHHNSFISLSDRIEALKILTDLNYMSYKQNTIKPSTNLTMVFLLTGVFGAFIKDLKVLQHLIENDIDDVDAQKLANHLLLYIQKVNKNNFDRYLLYNGANQSKLTS